MSNFALACASHTPLLMREELSHKSTCAAVKAYFDQLGTFLRDFAPEQIIQFALITSTAFTMT